MTRPTQFTERDLTKASLFPKITWSSISSFTYTDRNKTPEQAHEEWYQAYVLGKRMTILNARMEGGVTVGERIVADPTYLPSIPRPEHHEPEFKAKLGKIELVSHLDGWSPSVPGIDEYKTSTNKERWNQKKVDEWKQLDFYCVEVYENFKIKPEQIRLRLFAIPMVENGDFSVTQEGEPIMFTTKRTMKDLLLFCAYIKKVHGEMDRYITERKRQENEKFEDYRMGI